MKSYTEQKPFPNFHFIPSSYQIINSIAAAISLGIVFGLLEGIVKWIRMLLGSPKPMGHEILWAAPLVYAATAGIFAVFSIGLFLILNRILLRRNQLPTFVPILDLLLFIGFVYTILLIVPMNQIAAWVLALGLAKQAHVFLARRRQGTIGFLSSGAPILLALVCILFIIVSTGKKIHEYTFLARLPTARPDAPNVLLITLDTLRADHLSTYGYHRPTPNLDQFARERIMFEYALATSSWTLPTHATIMTGLYTHEHLADIFPNGKLDSKFYTLSEAFSDNGFVTAAFIANEGICNASRGFDQGFSYYNDIFWSFENWLRWTNITKELVESIRLNERFNWYYIGRKTADDMNQQFNNWLNIKHNRPFFVWLNYFDPHDPYYTPDPTKILYINKKDNGNPGKFGIGPHGWAGELNEQEKKAQIDGYDSSISYLDDRLGRLFQILKHENFYDNTIIIITSDHGEGFGEHGLYGHGNSLYRESLHVPLIIRYPATIKSGQIFTKPVSLADLAATITQLSGLSNSQEFSGKNLLERHSETEPLLAELMQNPRHPPSHPVAQGDLTSILTPNWYAIFIDEAGELYSFEDRLDQINLANTQAGLKILTDLKILLDNKDNSY